MNVNQLQSKVKHLEQELAASRQLLAQARHQPELSTAALTQSRAYAFNPTSGSTAEVTEGCADSLSRYGFCVIDNLIPTNQVSVIRQEVIQAQSTISRNMQELRKRVNSVGLNPSELLTSQGVELRPVRRLGHLPKPPNDIVWMPQYGPILGSPIAYNTG